MPLKLYFAHGANCSDRVRWVLAYKRIAFEAVDVEATGGSQGLSKVSPFGRVPVLETEHGAITESMAIAEFLEESYPEFPLLPADPLDRARVREVCEVVNASIHPVQNSSALLAVRPDWTKEEMRPFRSHWIISNLEAIQSLLWRASPFAVGSGVTLADIFVAVMYRKGVSLGGKELDAYRAHWEHLMSQPRVAASVPA
jgi:maleylacetoacetate isomerase